MKDYGSDKMTTRILIHEKLFKCKCFWLHDYHETDTLEYLKNHKNKKQVTNLQKKRITWIEITLTEKDIEELKKTSWWFNNNDNNILDKTLKEGKRLELISIE